MKKKRMFIVLFAHITWPFSNVFECLKNSTLFSEIISPYYFWMDGISDHSQLTFSTNFFGVDCAVAETESHNLKKMCWGVFRYVIQTVSSCLSKWAVLGRNKLQWAAPHFITQIWSLATEMLGRKWLFNVVLYPHRMERCELWPHVSVRLYGAVTRCGARGQHYRGLM